MALAAAIEPTVSWGMGAGVLSAGFSLANRAAQEVEVIPSQLLPEVQPFFRSLGWGAAFGAYQRQTTAFFDPHTIQDVYACYTIAAGAASATMEQLVGGRYWEYMEMAKPFAALYTIAFVVKQVAPFFIVPRIPRYPG
ncbi:MAG: hypothetical protein P0S96_03735 [Simkaniaceae bacterium]|nr:hypothetical protein [Candidatus Sacchlamyda saccharinae]